MKQIFLFVLLLSLGKEASAQSTFLYFASTDGTDASGWSYKDFVIPPFYKIDSVKMDATRIGYPTSQEDFVFESCQGTTVYNTSISTYPFQFSTVNTSLYNTWIDLSSFNYISVGMARVSLPTNAGATWNQVCFAISPISSDSLQCYTTPDGVDGSGWSYVDVIIPTNYRLDSVLVDSNRPGYPTSDFDFEFASCQGVTTYNSGIATYPMNWTTINTSMYNTWYDLTSYNYQSVGMVRVTLPTSNGAIWNQVCFAFSQVIFTSFNEGQSIGEISIFPNPCTVLTTLKIQSATTENINIDLYSVGGELCRSEQINLQVGINIVYLDLTNLRDGLYLISVQDKKLRLVINN